jgi:hypothetical protein
MATSNGPSAGPRDSLSRGGLMPIPADDGGRLAVKLALGAFAGLLLALAAGLPADDQMDGRAMEALQLPASALPPKLP